jgi:hypothetical protein
MRQKRRGRTATAVTKVNLVNRAPQQGLTMHFVDALELDFATWEPFSPPPDIAESP